MSFFDSNLSAIPSGSLPDKWENAKFSYKLVNPANRKKFDVIVVGAGLAGASAAASLGEMGYSVKVFVIHDSPRRAHSIAAQGGINSTKNYKNDGDSVKRLFYDTIKGGDFRSREANVHRLAEVSGAIIDQCVAQGVPFAREYGGMLANRSFGGAQLSRTFYARGQTGQQLLLGAYGALMRQVKKGSVQLFTHYEMLNLVSDSKRVQGAVFRNLLTGDIQSFKASAVLLATGGYGNVFYLSTNAMNSNVTASWRCHKKGALFANPSFVQIHPTCIPKSGEGQSKLTLMSESLRNDGRVWVSSIKGDQRTAHQIPEEERDYYLERIYPSFGNLVPRDVASRQAKFQIDRGHGVEGKEAVYLDFSSAVQSLGEKHIAEKYGNLFNMYERITGTNPYKTPMQIYPAVHYTMGGLWVDYNLQSSLPGLFVLGEANFSDHGANRLGASALMQGLADGYFVIPYSLGHFLAQNPDSDFKESLFKQAEEETKEQLNKLLSLKGSQTVDQIHKKLGNIAWESIGMVRERKKLIKAQEEIRSLRQEFWSTAFVPGESNYKNQELEKAGRVADFLELGELMAQDALEREESCGCHFRTEYQTSENEALRNDKDFSHVSAWEKKDSSKPGWTLHKENLEFEMIKPTERNYK